MHQLPMSQSQGSTGSVRIPGSVRNISCRYGLADGLDLKLTTQWTNRLTLISSPQILIRCTLYCIVEYGSELGLISWWNLASVSSFLPPVDDYDALQIEADGYLAPFGVTGSIALSTGGALANGSSDGIQANPGASSVQYMAAQQQAAMKIPQRSLS